MNKDQLNQWVSKLGKAWEDKNPKLIKEICAKNIKYYETPFTKPYTNPEQVEELWQDVPKSQKNIKFQHKIISCNKNLGIVHWSAIFIRKKTNKKAHLDGIFLVSLNKKGLCTSFR